jgi:hypothetical protein
MSNELSNYCGGNGQSRLDVRELGGLQGLLPLPSSESTACT